MRPHSKSFELSMSRRPNDKDSLYCPFYQKNGACMHGGACSRMHIQPSTSRTLLLANIYPHPQKFISLLPRGTLVIDRETIDRNFDDFYVDIYEEMRTFGQVSDMIVADNLCDHLVGNVLVKFDRIEDAITALSSLRRRWYAGRPIDVQFSPVENFSQAVCRQLAVGGCRHGGNCNFIHPRYPSDDILHACPLTEHVWEEDDVYMNVVHGAPAHRPEQRRDQRREGDYRRDRDDYRRDRDDYRRERDDYRRERDDYRRESDDYRRDRDDYRRDRDGRKERRYDERHNKHYDRDRNRDDGRRREWSGRDYERSYDREYERS